MKEKSFTRNQSGGWMSHLGRAAFLIMFAWCFVGIQSSYGQAFDVTGAQDPPVDCTVLDGNATATINVVLGSCAANAVTPPTFEIYVDGVASGVTTTASGPLALTALVVNAGLYDIDLVMVNIGGGDCGSLPTYMYVAGGNSTGIFGTFELPISTDDGGDFTPPTALCLSTITVALDPATNMATVTGCDIDAGSFDNCNSPMNFSITSANGAASTTGGPSGDPCAINAVFDCNAVGLTTNTIELTVDDGPNDNECVTAVVVVDNTPPTIVCPADITVQIDKASTSATFNTVTVTNDPVTFAGGTNAAVAGTTAGPLVYLHPLYGLIAAPGPAVNPGEIADNCGVFVDNPTTTDAGGVPFFSRTFTCADVGTTVPLTLTVGDGLVDAGPALRLDPQGSPIPNGLTASCTMNITIEEATPTNMPMCLPDFTVQVVGDGSGNFNLHDVDGANGVGLFACNLTAPTLSIDAGSMVDCNSTISSDIGNFNFDCAEVGQVHVVTLTIDVDNDGDATNDVACTTNITVTDEDDIVECLPGVTVNLNDPLQQPLTIGGLINGADTDLNCNSTLLVDRSLTFTCADAPGPINVTIDLDTDGDGIADGVDEFQTDCGGGGAANCVVVVTLVDIGPQAVCQAAGAVSIAVGATLDAATLDNGSTASCTNTPIFSIDPSSPSSFTCDDLGLQTVTLSVTDASGVISTCQTEVLVTGTSGATVTTTTVNPLCAGDATGTATVNITGGSGSPTFLWSNGQTSNPATGLAAGTYIVTISGEGCGDMTQVVTITDPPAINLSTIVTDVTCNGGSDGEIVANAFGGTTIQGFSMTDAAGNNIAPPFTGLAAGTYTVTVIDANACTATASVTVGEPAALTASVSTTPDNSCGIGITNGTVTAAASNGSGDYSYSWGGLVSTTDNATGLAGGTYSVTVTDNATGCTVEASGTVGISPDCGLILMGPGGFFAADLDGDCEFHEAVTSAGPEPTVTPVVIASGVPVTFADEGGLSNDYPEDRPLRLWTICPDDPYKQRIRITFNHWNVDDGDDFNIYQGTLSDTDEDGWLTCDDLGTPIEPLGEVGVNFAPNGGWVEAACENYSGCLTITFDPNNDGTHGSGWVFEATARDIDIDDFSIPGGVSLARDCAANGWYTIPSIAIPCGGSNLAVFARLPDGSLVKAGTTVAVADDDVITYEIHEVDGDGDLADNNGNGDTFVCFVDDNDDNVADGQTISVSPATALVCNDNVNISLDAAACQVKLLPDMVLEGGCDFTESINFSDFNPGTDPDFIIRINGEEGQIITEIGSHTYAITRAVDNSTCWGTINIEDKTAPTCAGANYDVNDDDVVEFQQYVLCSDLDEANLDALFPDMTYRFSDCSEYTVSTSDMIIGDCANLDTDGDGDVDAADFGGQAAYNAYIFALARSLGLAAGVDGSGAPVLDAAGSPVIVNDGNAINLDADGNPTLDADGNPEVLNANGNVIPYEPILDQSDGGVGIDPQTGSGASVRGGGLTFSRGGDDPVPANTPFGSGALDNLGFDVVKVIKRTFTAVDEHGNGGGNAYFPDAADQCFEFVFILQPQQLFLPAEAMVECSDEEGAGSVGGPVFYFDKDRDGILEEYPASHACGYAVTSGENSVDLECETKFVREYDVYDWCRSSFVSLIAPTFITDREDNRIGMQSGLAQTVDRQLIKIVDTEAPELTCVGIGDEGGALNPFYISTAASCALSASEISAGIVAPGATDACRGASLMMVNVFAVDSVGVDSTVHLGDRLGNNLSSLSLDCGFYAIEYAGVDDCGNITAAEDNCTIYFTINDDVAPTAICRDRLNVTLNSSGSAAITAASIDANSSDNCGVVSTSIRIMDSGNDFGSSITVNCDLKPGTQIELEVVDAKGNTNHCWAELVIEDKVNPVVIAPADATGTCAEFHSNVFVEGEVTDAGLLAYLNSNFGDADYSDNCGIQSSAQSISVATEDCGSFVVTRTFTTVDWGDRTASDVQVITITGVPNWKLSFPDHGTVDCGEAFPDSPSSDEIIAAIGFCDRLSINVEDQLFTGEADACVKLVRTFTVWNSCGEAGTTFNVNADNGGGLMVTQDSTNAERIVYVQTITADITEGPSITINGDDPEIYGTASKDGTPVCYDVKTIEVWAGDCLNNDIPESGLQVDITGPNGTVTPIDTDYNAEGQLIIDIEAFAGDYTVEVWASDGCGNSTGSTATYTFTDAKAPAIWALNGLATEVMPVNGTIDIWANDFLGTVVDCDEYAVGIWHSSLGEAPAVTGDADAVRQLGQNVDFDCSHIGTQLVRIYAIDASGNYDYVETYIIIQDNGGACTGTLEPTTEVESQVAGKVINPNGDLVEAVNVAINGASMSDAMTTSQSGTFTFTLPNGGDYTITPEKDINPLNGVSTFDLVLISKHILGVDPFDSPYEYIAADINNNGSITAFDIVQLRQLILNITAEFANNTSWRFVEAGHNFGTDVTTTLSQNYPEIMNLNNLVGDDLDNDFIAVKIGDVNGSATPNGLAQVEVRNTAGSLVLTTADRYVEAGETVEVAFASETIASVTGYQFTMNYAGLEVTELVEGVAKANNFNTNLRGAITTSWNGAAAANEVLFAVNFTATTSGALSELLSLSSDITTAEAYSTAGEVLDVAIAFTGTATPASFDLEQNTPNPFNGETVIGFTLPQAGAATLKVMDVQGKVLKQLTGDYVKGYNQISINAKELGATGILHYQLESAEHTATRKMIIID